MIIPSLIPLSDVHGDARFAKAEECADLLRGGVHLGYCGGKRLGYSGDQHLITIAPTGTGKGATAIIPTLLDYDASCIVIDPKGQAAAVTARARREMGHTVHFINPFGEHGLPDSGFNPLAGLDHQAPNFAAAVAALADALITPDDHGSAHWSDSARSLVKCLVMWTCIKEENPTLPTALTPLGWSLEKFRELMLEINNHSYRPMAHLAGRFTGDEYKDAPGIISTAVTQTEIFLEPLAAASLSRHSFEWGDLKRAKATVFLIPPVNSLGSHKRWLRLMVASALSGLYTSEKAKKPVLIILDEFAQLERLAAIESAVGIGRGFGIQFWPILQDLNQLEDLYGKRAESFMANMGIIQVFRPNDPNTAAYFSRKAGQSTVETTGANEGLSSSRTRGTATDGESLGYSHGETGKPLFSPQDLAGLPLDQQVIFKAGLQYPILADRVAYYHDAALAGRYDPDPYHLGQTAPPPPALGVWKPAAARPKRRSLLLTAMIRRALVPPVTFLLLVAIGYCHNSSVQREREEAAREQTRREEAAQEQKKIRAQNDKAFKETAEWIKKHPDGGKYNPETNRFETTESPPASPPAAPLTPRQAEIVALKQKIHDEAYREIKACPDGNFVYHPETNKVSCGTPQNSGQSGTSNKKHVYQKQKTNHSASSHP